MALRVVRAAVLTSFLAVVFLLLVVVGSANAAEGIAVSPSYSTPLAQSVPAQIRLVGDVTVVAAQTDASQAPAQNIGSVVQKTDIVVVAALAGLALWVWVRNGSTRKGH